MLAKWDTCQLVKSLEIIVVSKQCKMINLMAILDQSKILIDMSKIFSEIEYLLLLAATICAIVFLDASFVQN